MVLSTCYYKIMNNIFHSLKVPAPKQVLDLDYYLLCVITASHLNTYYHHLSMIYDLSIFGGTHHPPVSLL